MMLSAGALLGLNLRVQHAAFTTHEFAARGWPCWWSYDETEASKAEHEITFTSTSTSPPPAQNDEKYDGAGGGYPGTDAAYLADDSAPRRRGIDGAMAKRLFSEADSIVADLSRLTAKLKEESELVEHTSKIKHNLARNVALDSLCAVLLVLIPGALLEILMRKITSTRERASRRELELPSRPSS